MLFEYLIEIIEKIIAVVRVIFPRIFAIEYHAYNRVFSGYCIAADIFERMYQMLGGIPPKPLRILEADHIGKPLIPEETHNAICFPPYLISPIEITASLRQRLIGVRLPQAVGQNSFPARAPPAFLFCENFKKGFRYSPFRRPYPVGSFAEAARMTCNCRGQLRGNPALSAAPLTSWVR